MGTKAVKSDATAERVRTNVKRFREEQRLTLGQLAERLAEIGRPMLASGVSKIEQGDRRVDVDDLVALAVALEVNPNALLMPAHGGTTRTALTEDVTATARQAWMWAVGESPLATWLPSGHLGDYVVAGVYKASELARWIELTNAHKSPEELAEEAFALVKHDLQRRKRTNRKGSDHG